MFFEIVCLINVYKMCNVVRISRKQRLAHKQHAFYSKQKDELFSIKNCIGKHKLFIVLSSCPYNNKVNYQLF